MIRLTWLQFRSQAAAAAAALAAVAVILAVSGPHPVNAGTGRFIYSVGSVVLYLTPALIGIFWGAPLISRELETGTFRLAWTQSISRTRWLAVKLGLAGMAGMAAAGLLSLMVTWWASPIDQLNPYGPRLSSVTFGARDLTPAGYTAFAFALGVTVGLLVRRTLPAIAITLAVFAAVQAAVPLWVRPHLFTPVRTVSALNPSAIAGVGTFATTGNGWGVAASVNIPGAWVYSNQVTTPDGSTSLGPQPHACAESWNACLNALARLHLRQVVTYQPASRYWAFQWTETGLYLLLALLLAGFCIWRVNRRLSR